MSDRVQTRIGWVVVFLACLWFAGRSALSFI
jgi:hypothetical protein